MERSEDQNLALVREVLKTEPYRLKAKTTERGKVLQWIADNPQVSLEEIRGGVRETGVIAGSTNFSSNKISLRYQSSKTSRVFLKDVMELKHESITLSSLLRRALEATCSILGGVRLHEKTRTGASFIPRWLFDFVSHLPDDWVISYLAILKYTSCW